jgi:serine/threonine protein kinase
MKVCPACKTRFEDDLSFCTVDGEVLEDDPTSLVNSTLDGQYHIESLLGKGGMGAVFRARHILLGDRVAIKVLPPEMRNNAEWLRRFKREGQAARRFRHPNAVTVYDLRTTNDGLIYMVMEYVEGRTLDAELRARTRFTAPDALAVLEPVMSVLNAAHEQGVVHRDLKPENIMIGKSSTGGAPTVKLLDLGIAKLSELAGAPKTETNAPLTVVGQILGTPYYMSPEQWGEVPRDHNSEIDGRADIYSLGVVFYELITGRRPFNGLSLAEIRREHISTHPPNLHQVMPEVPEAFGDAIAQAMSKDRSDRPATAAELANKLRQALGMPTLSAAAFNLSGSSHEGTSSGASTNSSLDPGASTGGDAPVSPGQPTNYGPGAPTNYPAGSNSEATLFISDLAGSLAPGRDTGVSTPNNPPAPMAATSLGQMPSMPAVDPAPPRPAPQPTMMGSMAAQPTPPVYQPQPAYAPPAVPGFDAPPKKKGKAGLFVGVGGVLLVLGIIVLGVGGFLGYKYWYAAPESKPPAESKEAYRFWLEMTDDSSKPAGTKLVEDLPALKSGQSFRFHFMPQSNGFLYVIGQDAAGKQTTYLTNQPLPETGVSSNELKQGQEYAFPSGIWLTLDEHKGTEKYTIIVSPKKLDSPTFLNDTANKELTAAQNDELRTLVDKYSANKPQVAVNKENGGEPFITVKLPPGTDAENPVVYEMKLQHQ